MKLSILLIGVKRSFANALIKDIQEKPSSVSRTASGNWLSQLLQTGATMIQIILRALYLGAVFSPAVLSFIPLKLISCFHSSSPLEALWWDVLRSGDVITIPSFLLSLIDALGLCLCKGIASA